MFCLDDYDFDLYGTESSDEYAFIDLVYMPCNVKESSTISDIEDDKIDPQCVGDFDKMVEYVGPINYVILTNEESFK